MNALIARLPRIFLAVALLAVAIGAIYPLFFVINAGLKTDAQFSTDRFGLALPPSFDNLALAFQRIDFVRAAFNSLVTTVGGVVGAWIICLPAAYAATRMRFRFRNALFLLLLGSMLIPVQTILYPFYLTLRNFGLLSTHAGLIVTFVAFGIPMTVFQMAAYMRNLPDEVFEAARIDGASTWQILITQVLPLCRPVLAVTGIINFIWMWNDILFPVLIMQQPATRTLMIGAGLLKGQWGSSATLISAGLLLTILPVVVMFLLAQRQIIQGMTAGAVK